MSKRGENIYKRKDNRWEGRYIREKDADGNVHLGYVYASSYSEVRKKLALKKAQAEQETDKTEQRLSYYFERWLQLSKTGVKPSTYAKYRVICQNHLIPALGKLLPQELTSAVVDNFSSYLLCEKQLASKTVRDILSVLRTVTKYIRRQTGGIPSEIEFLYPKERKKEMRVLSNEEQQRFISFLSKDTDYVKFGVLLALLTGMRIGELCALRWKNIGEDSIRISQTMQRLSIFENREESRTHVQIGDAKSESSRRDIPLTEFAASLCKTFRPKDNNAYVLTGDSSRFMEPRALQYRFARYIAACNLDGVHFHCLRHTFATRCVEVGFEMKSLSEVLGHSSVKITLDRYVHSSPQLKRKNMDKLAAIGL